MKKFVVVLTVLIALAGTAAAHEGHVHHILGTVAQVDGETAVIKLRDGKEHAISFNEKTRFTKGAQTATRDDVKPGLRVSVDLADDSRTARSVKIGTAAK